MSKVIDVNTETGEISEREMTAEEIAQQEIDKAAFQARQAKIAAKAQAKAELLAHLGITEEQAKLLLS